MDPYNIPARLVRVRDVTGGQKKIGNTRSNHVISLENIHESQIVINMNQRLRRLFLINSSRSLVQLLDSAVVLTRKIDFVNCHNLTVCLDEVDLRYFSFFRCSNIRIQTGDSETLIENFRFYWHECHGDNIIERTVIKPGTNPNEHFACPVVPVASFGVVLQESGVSESRLVGGKDLVTHVCREPGEVHRSIESVMQELDSFEAGNSIIERLSQQELGRLYEEELAEVEDPPEIFATKVKTIAEAIRCSQHTVVYSGAGISTAAALPDYRGPEGVWTQRSRGVLPGTNNKMDLGMARPTYSHYAVAELVRLGLVKFVTSTNLDGLHRRSGVPKPNISELHGNCYREFCENCDREHFRSFDTLPTRQDRWTHHTGRFCESCGGNLRDSIVHFTEHIREDEWAAAVSHARSSDVALVLGTSMNVQPAASLPDKCLSNGGKLFIVNLQRTPYDEFAEIKVYARTDDFCFALMNELGASEFDLSYDLCQVMRQQEQSQIQSRRILWSATAIGIVAAVAFLFWRRH